ncbi:unnamed protein product [Thelazia callipaeda]|uniref:carnosine N-methyltransferase n=1 Tax=Thelazia callipaeda TaxID=103827 RepID=A0A0N5CX09_THECL|nr:unnamed protein product [Thelazia callipaeda]
MMRSKCTDVKKHDNVDEENASALKHKQDEITATENILNAMMYYRRYGIIKIHSCISSFHKLSEEQRASLSPLYQSHLVRMKDCIVHNQKILKEIMQCGVSMFGDEFALRRAAQITQLRPSDDHYMSKVKSTLKQIVRDWSSEGEAERNGCYSNAVRILCERFPDKDVRPMIEVLVPGAGLGRLVWELVAQGFSVQGNEFSILMLLTSNFILNQCKKANENVIYPYVLDTCNNWSYEDQLRPVRFPDVCPVVGDDRRNKFSMCAGDFLEAKKDEINHWDVIVTVFFIDTAINVLDYIDTIHRILKKDGIWINFGPLTYHFADDEAENSIELPYDSIIEYVRAKGFRFECDDRSNKSNLAFYACNPKSMLRYQYHCGFFICTKLPGSVSVVESEKYWAAPRLIRANWHEAHIIRWQRLNNVSGAYIVCVSGQLFNIYVVGSDRLNILDSTRAHPYCLTDVDWCSSDSNIILSSSIDDALKCWDLRDLRHPCLQVPVIGGAEQAKWSPLSVNLFCSSHGTDIRLWDRRSIKLPFQAVSAHMQKIRCLTWHPVNTACFLTGGLDGYVKMWDSNDLTKPRHSLGMLPAPIWKIKFSSDGDEFASIPLPFYGQLEENCTLSLWKTKNLEIIQCDNDILLDLCWQKYNMQGGAYRCLYSASRHGKLRKYNLPTFVGLESEPIIKEEKNLRSDESDENAFVFDEEIRELEPDLYVITDNVTKSSIESMNEGLFGKHEGDIIENGLCLMVPRKIDVLINELISLEHKTEGDLIIKQIDDKYNSIVLSKDTASECQLKIVLSLEAGTEETTHIIIKIISANGYLRVGEIGTILERLSKEAGAISLSPKDESALLIILHKLFEIMESMKVRTLSSLSLSVSYDRWIPSPRTCGARFNGSGFLVIFGRNEFALRRIQSSKASLEDESLWISAERLSQTIKSIPSKKSSHNFLGDEQVVDGKPHSPDDCKQELKHCTLGSDAVLRVIRAQNSLTYEKCTSPLCNSTSGTPIFPCNMAVLHQKFDFTNNGTFPRVGMLPSNSLAVLGSTCSNSNQNARLHRHRGNSGTNVLADDHHYVNDCTPLSVVVIYDVSVLMSVSRKLARKYRLLGTNALELCMWNRKVVEEVGRNDLAKIWQIVELYVRLGKSSWRKHYVLDDGATNTNAMSNPGTSKENLSKEDCLNIALHPFGRSLISSLLDYFSRVNDYQTAAMVICTLSLKNERICETVDSKADLEASRFLHYRRSISTSVHAPAGSVYNTFHGSSILNPNFRSFQQEKEKLNKSEQPSSVTFASKTSRNFSSLLQNAFIGHRSTQTPKTELDRLCCRTASDISEASDISKPVRTITNNERSFYSFLDPAYNDRFDEIRHQYADLLFRWKMFSKAAEVLKYSRSVVYSTSLRVRSACPKCGNKEIDFKCERCDIRWMFFCSLCQLPASGVVTLCAVCGHGGHAEHMVSWFKENNHCAYGCGCDCKAMYL